MAHNPLAPFEDPEIHQDISAIIRRFSTNQTDVRECALRGLDLSPVHDVLDLGCGFGFMAEAVAGRIAPDARITGLDAFAANESSFIARVTAAGRRADFLAWQINDRLPWPDRTFDLVVCSYSLYFFADALADIARVLRPTGLLVAITHAENAFRGLLDAIGLDHQQSDLRAIIQRFSAENAEQQLAPFFDEVSRRDYRNALVFSPGALPELLTYIRFKLPLVLPGTSVNHAVPATIAEAVARCLASRGEVVIEKDDACFQCRRPRCP
jgi:SAM-dependent methyltransferase